MVEINAMKVQLAVAALVNSVFTNVQANNYGSRGLPNKHGHTFYQSQIMLISL